MHTEAHDSQLSIERTRSLPVSEMMTAPPLLHATAVGLSSAASVAGPPSPENAASPLPATVVIVAPTDGVSLT